MNEDRNKLQCKHKEGPICRSREFDFCDPKMSYCVKDRNYDFKFIVDEAGEIPLLDLEFKRRDEKGEIQEYTIYGIDLSNINIHSEQEVETFIDEPLYSRFIGRELRLRLFGEKEVVYRMKFIKRKMTKKEIEKSLGYEIDLL